MTRGELLERLAKIRTIMNSIPTNEAAAPANQAIYDLDQLTDDIEADGVLDVQCPPELAESLDLPRPAAIKAIAKGD